MTLSITQNESSVRVHPDKSWQESHPPPHPLTLRWDASECWMDIYCDTRCHFSLFSLYSQSIGPPFSVWRELHDIQVCGKINSFVENYFYKFLSYATKLTQLQSLKSCHTLTATASLHVASLLITEPLWTSRTSPLLASQLSLQEDDLSIFHLTTAESEMLYRWESAVLSWW